MNLEPLNQLKLFGLNKQFDDLLNLYSLGKFPNKILLSGEKGIGKCTLAYHLINYALSINEVHKYDIQNYTINEDNRSYKLTLNKSNPNFFLIDVAPDKKNIDIAQIRNLISTINKSSFNTMPRFVLIDNIEYLNTNSVNALLKVIEEPNHNINFVLINNNKRILPTLKSRCLNFKISLTFEGSIDIINLLLNDNIFNLLNSELINHYTTPGNFYNIVKFSKDFDINLKTINLKEFLNLIINDTYYKKESSIKYLIYDFIELYFRNNTSNFDSSLIDSYSYFLKKINNVKKFNLDEESLFLEFKSKLLNG